MTTEHCLHCGDPLPPLQPDSTRPSPWCSSCGSPILAPPGFSIRELCRVCSSPVPVHGYNVKRLAGKCAECQTNFPNLDVNAPLKWLPPDSEFQSLASAPSENSPAPVTPQEPHSDVEPPASPPPDSFSSSASASSPSTLNPEPSTTPDGLAAPKLPSGGGPTTSAPPSAPAFPRFCDPHVLSSIGFSDLDHFFKVFARELAAENITVPRCSDVMVHAQTLARLFSAPALLPQPLVDALFAIQEFASPKNKRLLEKLACDANLDESRVPEGWALRLWLQAPFDLKYIKTLQAHIPENFYDGDIEYCDPDEDPPDSSSQASFSASASSSLAPSSASGSPEGKDMAPVVELNPCPRNRIARLPKEVRDSINRMLGQALTYAEILKHLGENSHGLNKSSLSRWKRGPYQAWLKHQQRLEESGAQLKFALEAVRHNENNQIHQATQQIAALRISELFSQLDLSALKEAVINDPPTLARLAHLLPKLSQGGLQCERQRHELALSKPAPPAEKPRGPIKRGISRKALRHIEQRLRLL